jgi:hypothetical protein
MNNTGFTEATVDIYASPELGHIGHVQLVFRGMK